MGVAVARGVGFGGFAQLLEGPGAALGTDGIDGRAGLGTAAQGAGDFAKRGTGGSSSDGGCDAGGAAQLPKRGQAGGGIGARPYC